MNLEEFNLHDEVIDFLETQEDFEIDRVSQEGGNCDIFFGHHKIFDRRVALKVYYGNKGANAHDEPRILSQIDHPNVLRIRDAKRIGENFSYFTTDEIDGGDLEKVYSSGGLTLSDKLNIIHGILSGLSELHKTEISIVHRDIKPKNILVQNSTKNPLIADFGSVKCFNKDVGSVTCSNTTMFYRPKEVFVNGAYTEQSDVYQVGVTMFQILGGFFPGAAVDWLTSAERARFNKVQGWFEQSIFIDKVIERRICNGNLLKMETLPDYIPSSLVKVLKKATSPDLTKRCLTPASFMRALFKIQQTLIDWWEDGDFLVAEAESQKFRIAQSSKGFSAEKQGATGKWRRFGDFTDERSEQIVNVIRKAG